jgi:hypothetical protein
VLAFVAFEAGSVQAEAAFEVTESSFGDGAYICRRRLERCEPVVNTRWRAIHFRVLHSVDQQPRPFRLSLS